jgi:GMP synthase-like glutamine amidotransferase
MRILILETGAPPPDLARRHGGYPQMLQRLLTPHMAEADYATARVFEGETPPPASSVDGVLITGSPAGVYEGHSWIAPLKDYLRQAAALRRPQVGICFGHQIMAEAFGGRVEKSDKGWGVGVHDYAVGGAASWMTPAAQRIACAVSHQDQVVELPPSARRLAGSAFCENGVIAYEDAPAISFQMHPEFEPAFGRDLLNARRGRIAAPLAETAMQSYDRPSDRALIARWIAAFYRSAY